MSPAVLQLILAGLAQVPSLVQAAAAIKNALSTTDQATLDAALTAAQGSLNTDINQLVADAQARS